MYGFYLKMRSLYSCSKNACIWLIVKTLIEISSYTSGRFLFAKHPQLGHPASKTETGSSLSHERKIDKNVYYCLYGNGA